VSDQKTLIVVIDNYGRILNLRGSRIINAAEEGSKDAKFSEIFGPVYSQGNLTCDISEILGQNRILFTQKPRPIKWEFERLNEQSPLFLGVGYPKQREKIKPDLFQDVFNFAYTGIAVFDSEKKEFFRVNPSFAWMHGYEKEELEGLTLNKVFAPDFLEEIEQCLNEVKTKKRKEIYAQHCRKDGSFFPAWVEVVRLEENLCILNAIDITAAEKSRYFREFQVEVLSRLSYLRGVNEIMEYVVKKFLKFKGFNGGGIYLFKEPKDYQYCGDEFSVDLEENYAFFLQKKKSQKIVEGQSLYFPDLTEGPRQEMVARYLEGGYRSLLILPLKTGVEEEGILVFFDKRPGVLESREKEYFEGFVQPLGYALKYALDQEKLQASHARYLLLFDNANDGILIMKNGVFVDCNRKAQEIFGGSKGEIVGKKPGDLSPEFQPDGSISRIESRKKIDAAIRGKPQIFFWQHKKLNGELVDVEVSLNYIQTPDGEYFQSLVRDITDRKRTERKLEYLSYYDSLTGIHNRTYFEQQMEEMDHSQSLPVGVIMGDVNGLKLINDSYGHREGDRLLKMTAEALKDSVGEKDIPCRYGGDEFSVLLPQTSEEEITNIARKIKEKVSAFQRNDIPFSISLGMAIKEKETESLEFILHKAEERMLRNKMLENLSGRNALFTSLQKTLFEKSNETEEHAQRMGEMARQVGEKLGLSGSHIDELMLLANLHDLGKIGIPEEIVKKPGSLDAEEWEIIKKHPEIGYRIAESIPELGPIAQGILSHHEWWDGSGYPRGLKGTEIPLIARIIAVLDAYDVMTNGRPYKKPIKSRDALEELKRCAGTQFDPQIVETFIDVIENFPEEY